MHGELIKAGQVQLLTYKQLRSLERMDAKKEKDKEVGQAFLGAGTAAVYSVGQVAKTTIEGVLKIAAAIAGNPDPISQGISIAAGGAALIWFVAAFPGLAKALHLDTFPQLTGAGTTVNPVQSGPGSTQPSIGGSTGPGSVPQGATIVPTGNNIYSLARGTLSEAANKAAAGDVYGCINMITSAGGDQQQAIQYCTNISVGQGQL